jgi:hypothetical protein
MILIRGIHHIQQRANNNIVGVWIRNHQTATSQNGAAGVADWVNVAAEKTNGKRLKRPYVKKLANGLVHCRDFRMP